MCRQPPTRACRWVTPTSKLSRPPISEDVNPLQILAEVETGNLWQDYLSVALDPAHILAELTFTIVFDGLVIALLWGVIWKQWLLPKLQKQIHHEFDEEHGIEHDADGHVHTTMDDQHHPET